MRQSPPPHRRRSDDHREQSPLIAALRSRLNYGVADLRGDVLGGLTTSGVVLPVAMGYGELSGLGPAAGLYGAVAVGVFAGAFGGTRAMVYGPNVLLAIPMAVVVAEYAESPAQAVTIGILAGLIQIAFGLLGVGRYAAYVPSSLISGLLTAFGLLIIVKQVAPALGAASQRGGVVDTVRAWPEMAADANPQALALTAMCIALGVLWRGRLRRFAPAPFVVLAAGALAGVFWLQDAPAIGDIPRGFPAPDLSEASFAFFLRVLQPAFLMALLSSIITLVTALRLDAITGAQHKPNREMTAQGIGNIAAGMVGGMPGSISQGSFVNAYSGGRTPVAGVTVAAAMLAVLLFLAPVAERIPFAVLAGILIVNGWTIIDWRFVGRLHAVSRRYAVVMLLTAALVLFADMITAIVVGLVAAALTNARRTESIEVKGLVSVPLLDRTLLDENERGADADPFAARTGLVVFPDRVTVASAREVSRLIRPDVRGVRVVLFDMSRTLYVDDSAAVILSELVQIALAQRSRLLVIAGLTGEARRTLETVGFLGRLRGARMAADLDEAKEAAREALRADDAGASAR